MRLNPRCQGANCIKSSGEVKPLQTEHGEKMYCESCYYHEMKGRRIHNQHDPRHQLPVQHWAQVNTQVHA